MCGYYYFSYRKVLPVLIICTFQTPKDNQNRVANLARGSTLENEVIVESGFSPASTVSTPTHNIPRNNSTSDTGSPSLKILPNGIGKDIHKAPEK